VIINIFDHDQNTYLSNTSIEYQIQVY